jgi:polar amino acid transport system substrate-binding protein
MHKTLMALTIAAVATLPASVPTDSARAQNGTVPAEVVKEFAPTGKLRAAINVGNLLYAQKDPKTGELRGITPDLARALAQRLGVPIEFVTFGASAKVFEALKSGVWDLAFMAIEPERATEVAFSPAYMIIEGTYVVPAGSPLRTTADVDREGIRVAVGKGSAYDLYLTRTVKRMQIVRAATSADALDQFLADKLDAAAGVRQRLAAFAAKRQGLRVMDDSFQAIQQAMGTPRGRDAAARYLRSFVEEMKASGFVADSLKRSGQEATVAPPATN